MNVHTPKRPAGPDDEDSGVARARYDGTRYVVLDMTLDDGITMARLEGLSEPVPASALICPIHIDPQCLWWARRR
ncbi:hypothetical protein [Stackebrandtia soli]|uniref:hypothetical protein n=1 Tax=Stackebrandtia soli TaxID=1892856 RepID=UPI0039EA44B1